MALQDNFNAIYNKKEQAKKEKELLKQFDITLELQLQEELQEAIETYVEDNNKNNLYLIKTKHKIIDNVIRYNNFTVYKYSKYVDIQNIKNYLSKIYDKTVVKVIRIMTIFDKEAENKEKEFAKQQEQILELQRQEEIQKEQEEQHKKYIAQRFLKVTAEIIVIAFIGIVSFIYGMLKELTKIKKY